ncbi:MAG: hypothetical protein ACI9KE_003219 [Polyangiales bacterium]|jgi:hypothetical protein
MVRAVIHAVHEDSTPSDPNRLVAAYASRVDGSYHSVWGGFPVELSSGAERTHAHLAITNANLIVPSLARGERREFVIGDEVILTGEHLDETFFGTFGLSADESRGSSSETLTECDMDRTWEAEEGVLNSFVIPDRSWVFAAEELEILGRLTDIEADGADDGEVAHSEAELWDVKPPLVGGHVASVSKGDDAEAL